MKSQLLYDALVLHRNHFKPTEVWDKLAYASQMLYCEQAINSGSYKKFPEGIVFHVENEGAMRFEEATSEVIA